MSARPACVMRPTAAVAMRAFGLGLLWRRSLVHHAWLHLGTALAAAVGAAVLIGALLVGDSMRGSLRAIVLARLGNVEYLLRGEAFFDESLAAAIRYSQADAALFAPPVPVVLARATLQSVRREARRSLSAELIGCDARFSSVGLGPAAEGLGPREIALGANVARELGVGIGDELIARVAQPRAIPSDSALGKKDASVVSLRLTVKSILTSGASQFGLAPNQQPPRNAFVPLATLQEAIEQPRKVNAILIGRRPGAAVPFKLEGPTLGPSATLADIGIRVESDPRGFVDVTSERMILAPATVAQIAAAAGKANVHPIFTYLANTIACGDRSVPYSTITALDFARTPPLGPWIDERGNALAPLQPDEIVLNDWTAQQLAATPGAQIRVSYFDPTNAASEHTHTFTLVGIVPLASPANDRRLTPAIRGMTDQATMDRWDPPFPFDSKRIRDADETYWDTYGPTPKAFVALATGQRLWGSRFGEVTSMRIVPSVGQTPADLVARIDRRFRDRPSEFGVAFEPVRAQALAAAAGATPFEGLFLGFSLFLLIAAALLVGLVFRLSIEIRAAELGVLTAIGFPRRRVAGLLAAEAACVALVGALIGIGGGAFFAVVMIGGLKTWWYDAVLTDQLSLHATAPSIAIGAALSIVIAMVAMLGGVRRALRVPPRRLLAGELSFEPRALRGGNRIWLALAAVALLLCVGGALFTLATPGVAQPPAFFACGGGMLLSGMLAAVAMLKARGKAGREMRFGGLAHLAWRNAARRPLRSATTIGLMAVAVFLLTAISAFRVDPSALTVQRDNGAGGYALFALSDRPFFHSPATKEGRAALGASDEDEAALAESEMIPLRIKPGDDASCLNLYQARRPTIVGLPDAFLQRGGFAWAAQEPDRANPWAALTQTPQIEGRAGGAMPVVMEQATANYALHLWGGVGEPFKVTEGAGQAIDLRVAGLLDRSIFQGMLLSNERDLLQMFPEMAGYRAVLVDTRGHEAGAIARALENVLGDYGLEVERTPDRLARFAAVENTYLSTFQSIGGLGLILGALGLGAVQMRNGWERRREVALLAAVGFSPMRLRWLMVLESLWLLGLGIGIGLAAAAIALLPQIRHALSGGWAPWEWTTGMIAIVLAAGLAATALAAWRTPRALRPLLTGG